MSDRTGPFSPIVLETVMRTILVVHSVDTCSARVWLCITDVEVQPPDVLIQLSNGASRTVRSSA